MPRRSTQSGWCALAMAGVASFLIAGAQAADRAPAAFEDAEIDQRSCELNKERVFTPTPYGAQCVAYYATKAGGDSRRAVVYFQGDYLRDQLIDTPRNRAAHTQTRVRLEQLAARYDVRFIIIARPGTLGSSGVQVREKHHRRELEAMNRDRKSVV